MFELMDAYSQSAVIKVIGVGGGGGNAVAHMVLAGIDGVEFMCINTDSQALKHAKVKTALQIGCNITKGLGAGADPEVGRQAAMEMARRGISVVITGRDPERRTAVAEDLARESGNNNVAFEQADAASQQSIRELAARGAERHERLDILVNNVAGLCVQRTLTVDGVEATLAVTHLASYLLTRLRLPALARSEGARVVNVTSGTYRAAKLDFGDLQAA